MATPELMFVYVTGPDSPLREAGHELLVAGAVTKVDLLHAAPLTVKDSGRFRVGAEGRAVVLVAYRDRLDQVFDRLRAVSSDVAAYAMPVAAQL
jgi:hypothetical protein